MANSSPLTERRYLAPFILITSLFFLWAFGVNLNDILIPRFKNVFALSDFQSSFIQVAFFSGYCLAALPAGRLMERIGYKRGILTVWLCVQPELCYSCPRRQPEPIRSSSSRCLSWLAARVFLK
jgi:fucose permease